MASVQRTCRCGAKFMAKEADIRRGWAKSCSKRCAARRREKRTGAFANYLYGNAARSGCREPQGEPNLSEGDRLPAGYVGSWTDEYGQPCFNDAHHFSNEEHDCSKD